MALAGCFGNDVELWDLRRKSKLYTLNSGAQVTFSPDNSMVAQLWAQDTLEADGRTVKNSYIDGRMIASGEPKFYLKVPGVISFVRYSPDSRTLVALRKGDISSHNAEDQSDSIIVWDVGSDKPKFKLSKPGGLMIDDVSFTPDSTIIAATQKISSGLAMWDLKTGILQQVIDNQPIENLRFFDSGLLGISDSAGSVQVWALKR